MNIFYPKIRPALLPTMLGYALLGGLLAGDYGMLHDQVTYSISQEYFTRFKFFQFYYADFGLPPRIFVAEIGFLATWWVGFVAAWFIARVAVPAFSPKTAFLYSLRGFLIIFAVAFAASLIGYVLGVFHNNDYSAWKEFESRLHITDMPSFVRVAYIHNAGYLGGLIGLILAIFYLHRIKKSEPLHSD